MESTDSIKELVRKRCEKIEAEQKKIIAEQRQRQIEIMARTGKIVSDTEGRLKNRSKKQAAGFMVPIFIVVTAVLLYVLHSVGADFEAISIVKVFCVSFAVSILIGIGFFCVTKTLIKDVTDLSNGLEAIADGNVQYRLNVDHAGPLTKAYLDYNDMAEKLELYREHMEAAVEEAERANRAKSDFLSNMSHEIRTPMNAVVGMTEILLRGDLTNQQREYLMNIKNSGAALLTIINDILDISKIESGKMEIVDDEYEPMSMLNDLSMIFLNRIGNKPIDLIYDIDTSFPSRLYGDSLRIRQILINLANNAIKFTDKGMVTLKSRIIDKNDDIYTIHFEISDTGQGIKEEDINKLFSSFSQVESKKNHHKEGTGLGLSISKQLVELMGGNIGVRSKYGEGSTFYFTIKQKVINPTPIEIEDGPKKIVIGSLGYGSLEEASKTDFTAPDARILIVDDNEMNLKVVKGLLEPLSMKIDVATGGKEAIAMIQEIKYDIIFMDHMMPEMDGIETAERIRALGEEYFIKVPIVALTANAVKEDRELFFNAGMNDFVAKPINYGEICACIREWLPNKKILADVAHEDTLEDEGNYDSFPEGLDWEEAIKLVGSKKLYFELLSDYAKVIDMKANKISDCLSCDDLKNFTIEVHGLKNTTRLIGDMKLSDDFKKLEELSRKQDTVAINEIMPGVMERFTGLKELLQPYIQDDDRKKVIAKREDIIATLKDVYARADAFDIDGVDRAMALLKTYKVPEAIEKRLNELESYVVDIDTDNILKVVMEMLELVG